MSAAPSVNITSAKWRCITTSVPRNTIPTASCTMDGQTARRSRPVSNWRKTVRPVPRTTNHSRTKPIDSLQRTLCVHDPVPWTRTSHRP
jgi:hypothetical protein